MAQNGGIIGPVNVTSRGNNTVNTKTSTGCLTTQPGTRIAQTLIVAGGGSGGAVTPSFNAAGGGGAGGYRCLEINTQTGKTILPFNNTGYGYNIGNHFNTSNHTFTAPLAGRYLVLVSVNVIGDNIVYIYKNGSENMGGEYRSNPTGPWEHIELCGVIECSANDTIQAYSYLLSSSGGRKFNGGSNPGSYWDTLSIYYLG